MPKEIDEIQKITGDNGIKAKVVELRVTIMRDLLKDPELENEDFINLSDADKITVTNEMKKIIAANPDIYGERSEIAEQLGDISKPEVRTIGDNLKSFGDEIAEQAKIKGNRLFTIAAVVGILAGVATIGKVVFFPKK